MFCKHPKADVTPAIETEADWALSYRIWKSVTPLTVASCDRGAMRHRDRLCTLFGKL